METMNHQVVYDLPPKLAADWAKGRKRPVCVVLTITIIPKPKPEGLGYGN
jgi:hypothetical protein